jgi:RNA repair, ligase-Pnkp-associating, region of Hen1
MLLTISYAGQPATDLGYLLHKSPFRVHSFEQVFGKAHVFYPETTPERCIAALLLEIDPIGLVRNRRGPSGEAYALDQYVNDRPYAASSFLSVAVARTFGTAITGRSKERQELADTPLPLEARITVLPCRGGESLLRRLFVAYMNASSVFLPSKASRSIHVCSLANKTKTPYRFVREFLPKG